MLCRDARWMMLACTAALAACSGDGGHTAGDTELNVIVPNNESAPGVPAPIDIQTVEYTINCLGNADTFLDNNASFPDEVVINGNLEVVDGRTSGSPPVPTEIWQGFMDLPPGPCTVQLRARDGDGEVICTATEPFNIAADTTTKVNMVLICDVSYQAPVGMLDVDATFSFNVGNFCPDLFVLNCLDSNPVEQDIGIGVPVAITTCETRFRDGDGSCGQNCDPQTCTPDAAGLTCTPGPDPGVSTTVTCDPGLQIDCDGNPSTAETECTFSGDTLGSIGGVEGTFNVACVPPAFGGIPGLVGNCTAVTTDGDVDCDKTKVVSVNCPGETPCVTVGCIPGEDCAFCADGNDCTAGVCDDSSGAALCVNVPVPASTPCIVPGAGIGWCDGLGFCQDPGCTVDEDCNTDGNECTVAPPGACDLGTGGLCLAAEVPVTDGTSCAGGTGTCIGGACLGLDRCLPPACNDGNGCTQDLCDDTFGVVVCSNPPEPAGTLCTDDLLCPGTPGVCDGAGACTFVGCIDDAVCDLDGDECTIPSCDLVCGLCNPEVDAPDGTSCDFGAGTCVGGVCNVSGGNSCPRVQRVLITPLQNVVGGDINVSATALDVEDDPIAYLWTGTGGTFADPTAPSTTFTCTDVGAQSITITVSDDGFALCTDDVTLSVNCLP